MAKVKDQVEAPVDPVYDVGDWNGLAQLRCRLCSFDTLNGAAAMHEHLLEVHQITRRVEV